MYPQAPVEIGQLLAGKYRVDRVLGQGGMGIVVAATHTQLDQQVAVKFLLPEATGHPQAVTRFLREAKAAVKIQSEFVARVTDVGTLEETGTPYMVMEYLEGKDLEGVLEERGPLPVDEAAEYVIQACAALAEAHSHGIIHRDLKPANLFRTVRSDGTPVVKVLDFGISKVTLGRDSTAEANLTGTAAVLGTPMYMSPEQIRSTRDVDNRTDIWALGSILHELLSGTQPFAGDSLPAMFASILESQPNRLRETRLDVPEALDGVVRKCLEKKPEDRYNTVAELAADLVPFVPPRSAELASRAARVLGLRQSGAPASALPASQVAGMAATQRNTGTGNAQTGVAWGNTQAEAGPSKALIFGGLGAALIAGGAGVFFLLKPAEPSAPPDTLPSTAPASTGPAQAPTPGETQTVVPAPPPTVEPSTAKSAKDAGAKSAAETVEPQPPPAAPKPQRPVLKPPRPQRPAPPATRPPAPSPPATPPPRPTPSPQTPRNPLDIEIK